MEVIAKICDRAEELDLIEFDKRLRLLMDLSACHANGCRLKLDELLKAEPMDFAHDISGIQAHMNRETGQLEDCFSPRYTEKQ